MSSPPNLIPVKFHRPLYCPSQASSSSSSSSSPHGIPHSGLGERSLKRLLDERSRSIVLGESTRLGTRSSLTTRLDEGIATGDIPGDSGSVHVEKPMGSNTRGSMEKSKKRKSQAMMSPSLPIESRSVSPQSTTSTKAKRNGINWSLILSGCTPTALLQGKGWKGEGNHRSEVEWVSEDLKREREGQRLELEREARATTAAARQSYVKRGRQPGQSGKGRRSVQPSPCSVPPPRAGRSGNGHALNIAVGGITPRMGLRSPRSPASSRESSPAVALSSVAHHVDDAEAGGDHAIRTRSGTRAPGEKEGHVFVGGRDGPLPPPSPLRASAVPRFASGMGLEETDEGRRRRKRSRSTDSGDDNPQLRSRESLDIPSTTGSRSPEKNPLHHLLSAGREIGRSTSHPIFKSLEESPQGVLPPTIHYRRTLSHDGVASPSTVGLFEHPSIGMARSGSGRSRRETTMPRALKDYDTKITA